MLDNRGLEYTQVDVTEDADALAFVKGLGYQAAPIVYTQRVDESVLLTTHPPKPKVVVEHWTQFQPDRIKAIVK